MEVDDLSPAIASGSNHHGASPTFSNFLCYIKRNTVKPIKPSCRQPIVHRNRHIMYMAIGTNGTHALPLTTQRRQIRCFSSSSSPPPPPEEEKEAKKESSAPQVPPETQQGTGLAKGQPTAIITGAISIIFGIAYLALVQFLDLRGGELQPPPPEAFMQ